MVTAFVVHQGPADPSLAVAPQVPQSIYYKLPQAAEALLGFSEISYRLPSILAMAVALLLTSLLAARLIHPQAGWFAAFACLGLRGINTAAGDARMYALGMCVAAAAMLFLVRWLDSADWRDALAFIVFGALVWRVHLIFWPFYVGLAAYALVRLERQDTPVSKVHAGLVFALLGIALVPVLMEAVALNRDAHAHVIVPPPTLREFIYSLQVRLILECTLGAWLLYRILHWKRQPAPLSAAAFALVGGWWLLQPFCLYGYSWLTGNSVFVARYLSLGLPGAALAATAAVAFFLPSQYWKRASAALGVGVLLVLGHWWELWPMHARSNWRAAAAAVNQLSLGPETPVICPSPFIEAKPPAWRSDYRLPGFLYAHLPVYPIRGKEYLFPFEYSPPAEEFASKLAENVLPSARRFFIYGGDRNALFWRDWFARRPELAGWSNRRLGPFGDVEVVEFEKPAAIETGIRLRPGLRMEYSSNRSIRLSQGGVQ